MTLVFDSHETESVLAALVKRRAELEVWLDGPAKKATLTSIDRMIAELEDATPSAAAERSADRR